MVETQAKKDEMIKQINASGQKVTPEVAKAVDALAGNEVDVTKVVGGMSPTARNVLITAAVIGLGGGGVYYYKHRKHPAACGGPAGGLTPPATPATPRQILPDESGGSRNPVDVIDPGEAQTTPGPGIGGLDAGPHIPGSRG
jgi:hypothetical protein